MKVAARPPLWSCGLGPVVRVYRGFEKGFREKIYGEFMVLGGIDMAHSQMSRD